MHKIDLNKFTANHINATRADFVGNGENGRYVFVPGSASRAKEIAEKYFSDIKIKQSSRGYDLYLGTITYNNKPISVASISTGMGAPSIDIILSELILLGAKRFLRIGTAGSLQPQVKIGDLVFATSAVRDESTSTRYVPSEFPAVCSTDFLLASNELKTNKLYTLHFGPVHSKDSLFAREFLCGPSFEENEKFIYKLHQYGVLATEMECSQLYVLSQLHSQTVKAPIKSGCVLAIIGGTEPFVCDPELAKKTIANAVDFGVQLMGIIASAEN